MSDRDTEETIVLLRRAAEGDIAARDQAWTRMYDEVLLVARAQRRRWSGDWTMETRVLANEVFIKLFGQTPPSPNDRKHFFVLLSRAVRQILVNYSEGRRAAKRGGSAQHVTFEAEPGIALDPELSDQLLDLHDALHRFEQLDGRAANVVELRFFAGLTDDESADTRDVSRATAVRDWEAARAWLNRELAGRETVELAPGPIADPAERAQ